MKVWILKEDKSFNFEYDVPKGAFKDHLLPSVPYMRTAPPQTRENEKAYGEKPGTPDERWVIKPDFNGVQYWLPDGTSHICQESGVGLPEGSTLEYIPTLDDKFEYVRQALQAAIDSKAKELGFSGGNALILYAGFTNSFQSLAQHFAAWEVSVWVQAEAYKQEVINGSKTIVSPDEAVAMMPEYQ